MTGRHRAEAAESEVGRLIVTHLIKNRPKRAVMMELQQIRTFALLRAVIGYLGEREQAGWWPSTFFAAGSSAFLTPVFPRTAAMAKCKGVTQAAALVHDERIGVGQVFHLFRLPEEIELRIHRVLYEESLVAEIDEAVADREQALDFLRIQAGPFSGEGVGPVHMGDQEHLRDPSRWRHAAAHYVHGVEAGSGVYPYFSARI